MCHINFQARISYRNSANGNVIRPCLDRSSFYFSHSFREIGQKSSEELAREGSGVKAFASFLSELGTLVPELMIPNISVLITHLEGEVLHTWNTFILLTFKLSIYSS